MAYLALDPRIAYERNEMAAIGAAAAELEERRAPSDRRTRSAAEHGFYAKRYPLGAAGAVIVAVFVLMAIFAPWITQFDPTLTNSRSSLRRPAARTRSAPTSWAATCGAASSTARAFRSRSGIGSTGLGCLFGVTIGLTSGYFGGWHDLIVQRVMDMMHRCRCW